MNQQLHNSPSKSKHRLFYLVAFVTYFIKLSHSSQKHYVAIDKVWHGKDGQKISPMHAKLKVGVKTAKWPRLYGIKM